MCDLHQRLRQWGFMLHMHISPSKNSVLTSLGTRGRERRHFPDENSQPVAFIYSECLRASITLTSRRNNSVPRSISSHAVNFYSPLHCCAVLQQLTAAFRYSLFPDEAEILLSPNACFIVACEATLEIIV
jgi:hypothetical protein